MASNGADGRIGKAATVDVLCVDKTGTLTQNELNVTTIRSMDGFDDAHVVGLASLASSDGGQDSVDAAIRLSVLATSAADLPKLVRFVPFDPASKMSEASATGADGAPVRIVKGAFSVVKKLAQIPGKAAEVADELLRATGFRGVHLMGAPGRVGLLVPALGTTIRAELGPRRDDVSRCP
jgi:H+-transporting ATPase